MEITDTLDATSDQQNAIDFTTGPRTFTVKECRVTGGDQPVSIDLVGEDGRPYRPSKNMRRVLANAWGPKKEAYAGRRFTLYRDPEVMYSGKKLGGIKISHMSHLDRPVTTDITEKRQPIKHTVQPLIESAPKPTTDPGADAVAACTDTDLLREWWQTSGPERKAQIEARVAEINTPTDSPDTLPNGGES